MKAAKEGLFHSWLFLNHHVNVGKFLCFSGPVSHAWGDNAACITEPLESLRVTCDMGEMQTAGQSQEITEMGQVVCGAAWVFHGPCLSILKRQ